ncbi:hypothetical protein JKP88DRAFT_351682 [Tribonema minus]|uniref:GDP-mannose transporter n=1 Tax=Tribonema minus TaxID=303371 RepID=A0A836C853_9STRA|nr:hypothetical protein JKP88DRAFT_351682 [Tribonema minus]
MTTKAPATVRAALLSCLAYSSCSLTMVLANKALASSFDANFPILMVVFQCLVAVLLVETSRRHQWVENYALDMKLAMQWVPVNLFFCAMLFTSFMALKWMNVPMVTVFKNLTNVIIVWGDWHFYNQSVTLLILASLGVMVFGAALAGKDDMESNAWGYIWMSANCVTTASYILYMKYATRSIKLTRFGMVFYNNLLGFVLLAPVALAASEVTGALCALQSVDVGVPLTHSANEDLWFTGGKEIRLGEVIGAVARPDLWTLLGEVTGVIARPDLWASASLSGEVTGIIARPDLWTSASFMGLNLFAGAAGFCLNFASLWCVGATSATTYAIVGSVNKVPMMVLGWMLFKSPIVPMMVLGWMLFKSPITAQSALYMTISLTGGFMYSWAKVRQAPQAATERPRDAERHLAPIKEGNAKKAPDTDKEHPPPKVVHKPSVDKSRDLERAALLKEED